MGSAISSLTERDWEFSDEDDPNRGSFLSDQLPPDQRKRLAERWMEKMERKRCVSRGLLSAQNMALPHVQRALHHYNSMNPGALFDLVEPLICNRVGIRDEIWFHVNLLARPHPKRNFFARSRNAPLGTAEQHFFAELHYRGSTTPVVETCIILEKPLDRFKIKCAFCKGTLGILHPSKEEFLCGRSSTQKKEYYQICMWRKMPMKYTSPPEEGPTSVQRQFEQMQLEA